MKTSFMLLCMFGVLILLSTPSMGDWSPVQPIPVRSAMKAVDNFPSTTSVVAAGDSGIVYRSIDAGVTWTQSTIASHHLNAIACYSDQFAVTAGDSGTLAITNNGGDSWSTITLATDADILSVSTYDDSTFALGFDNGDIWTTNDQGDSWTIGTTPGFSRVYAIDYAGEDELWAAAGHAAWKTIDGGQIWTSVRSFSVTNLTDVVFLSHRIGFFSGIHGDIYQTRDGGTSWDSTLTPMLLEPMAMVAMDSAQVSVVDGRGNFQHCNGLFQSWTYDQIGGCFSDITYLDWQGIYVVVGGDGSYGGASGYGAITARSTDQGNTWTYSKFQQETRLRSIFFLDENEGWAVGGNDFQYSGAAPEIVVHTPDGGSSWETLLMEPGGDGLTDIYFLDSDTGWVMGNSRMWRTHNGGQDWDETIITSANGMDFIDGREGWYCGIGGIIRHTTDAGSTWTSQWPPSCADYLYSIDFVDDQHGWCTGYNWQDNTGVILRTYNGGVSWCYQFSESHSIGFRSIRSIDMINSECGIAVSTYGTILETTIGDTSWTQTTAPDSTPLNTISHPTEQIAWAAGDDGYVIYKTPASTWQIDTVLTEHRIMDIFAVDQDNIFASTDKGIVLIYTPDQSVGDDNHAIPQSFALHQNYPNPFNPSTEIRFDLRQHSHVTLSVYNVLGQKVLTLVDKPLDAGTHLVKFNGASLASGVYFYQIDAGSFIDMKKMVLLK